jgi:glycosyltransferase involved in cell wall biosynthesis
LFRGECFVRRASILHIGKFYPPHDGGMETHVRDLAVRQIVAADVNVIVANGARRNESALLEGVAVTRVARMMTIASMPVCPGLTSAVWRMPADLVHIHMPNPGAAQAFLMSGHKGRVVLTHHADTVGRKLLRRLSDPFVKKLMQRASRIIVTSVRYLDSSIELDPFRDKCSAIPLGIDLDASACIDGEEIARLRDQFGERLIVAVGRLVAYKGFDVLIRAMKDVDAKLVLIGAGPEYDSLRKLGAVEGVSEKVVMPGRVADVRPYFAAAKFLVLPSVTRAEAFGMVQLEAMAAGLPVINTDIDSGVPEVSVHDRTGITVAPGDVGALSHAMRLLLARADLRARYGENARARVNNEFTVDVMAERTMALYAEVLGDGFALGRVRDLVAG